VSDVTFHNTGGRFGPWIEFQDKESYGNTKELDREAMMYLSWVMYPLLLCYAVYSLFYEEHRGWYSYILSTLVGFVYMFGFIMMCPQLYLNYKLKSVAHLPWRMLTYKFLNTIIDDLFAFIITMPTLHRFSCFRDDVVFLIFLYQKWIYPVDMGRANEYGFVPEEAGENKLEGGKENRRVKKSNVKTSGPELERSKLIEVMEFLNKELRIWEKQADRIGAKEQDYLDRVTKYNIEYGEFLKGVEILDLKNSLTGDVPQKLSLNVETLQFLPSETEEEEMEVDQNSTSHSQSQDSQQEQKEEPHSELLDGNANISPKREGLRKRTAQAGS